MDTYAYVGGNPLVRTDVLGLWSEKAHNNLISRFGANMGFSAPQMKAIMKGSLYADSLIFQLDSYSYMHAMTSDVIDDRKKACELANQFVKNKLNKYSNSSRGGRNKSKYNKYFQLGMAMHTVMDSTSPAHRGFQKWSTSNRNLHGNYRIHSRYSGVGIDSVEDLSALLFNEQIIKETVGIMESVFNGGELDCGCY